jgi:hypothetical protein
MVRQPDSASRVETLIWGLSALIERPSSGVFDVLSHAHKSGWNVDWLSETGINWIDYGAFAALLNGQDWTALVSRAGHELSENLRVARAGAILCVAATIWCSNHNVRPSDRHRIAPPEALEMFVEGVDAMLRGADEVPFALNDFAELPDGLPDGLRIELAERVIELTEGRVDHLSMVLRTGAARALREAGALFSFMPALLRGRAQNGGGAKWKR